MTSFHVQTKQGGVWLNITRCYSLADARRQLDGWSRYHLFQGKALRIAKFRYERFEAIA